MNVPMTPGNLSMGLGFITLCCTRYCCRGFENSSPRFARRQVRVNIRKGTHGDVFAAQESEERIDGLEVVQVFAVSYGHQRPVQGRISGIFPNRSLHHGGHLGESHPAEIKLERITKAQKIERAV